MSGSIKKWFMLQMWRIQQVAQILVLTMMAITDALLVYDYTDGLRVGGEPLIPYRALGVLFVLILIGGAIWAFAIIWDLRLKMWREQMTVLAEKNPFTKEKLTPKEVFILGALWMPLLERLGKDDPALRNSAEDLRKWIRRSLKDDKVTDAEVDTVLEYIGVSKSWLLDSRKE
ncbi:MAG: hypothetical protein JSV90_03865 [Methanobacteriota archaeon]|nr:MAG: hypothetical protein JSV90_03865 [Euryarchaeota archaeon]